jgi:hypothetical protein
MIRFIPFLPYILGGVVAAMIGLASWNMILGEKNRNLAAQLQATQARHQACSARILDITEDKQSDATVTDPGTFPAPDGWFLPEADTPGAP